MKILVLGSKGQLGQCLNDQLSITEHDVVYTSRGQIDIAEFEVTKAQMLKISPDIVINATAYTAVDKAEDEHQAADRINHLAVANISSICNQLDCWLIHVSTDYVFDGNASRPYLETDATNPQSVYGATKLSGEYTIQCSGCKYLIIRTAWVFSEYGNNFLKTMLRLGTDRDELSIVGDQVGCPTYAQDIAKAIVSMLDYLSDEDIVGVYHFSGDEQCSWFQFGHEIFQKAEEFGFSSPNNLQSISTRQYPTPAKRPSYSVLDSNKVFRAFGILPSDWRAGIANILRQLKLKQVI